MSVFSCFIFVFIDIDFGVLKVLIFYWRADCWIIQPTRFQVIWTLNLRLFDTKEKLWQTFVCAVPKGPSYIQVRTSSVSMYTYLLKVTSVFFALHNGGVNSFLTFFKHGAKLFLQFEKFFWYSIKKYFQFVVNILY